ncbi:glycosyltransferase family 2 protein [Prevotella melaninogenica]|uniref:Glycosyltransferase family 2 protein n=1 Tax=Prevotella melaninogenica TaxID=28132 RepID=A0A7D4FYY4_9BACT|nr:glycosyltransferase family 2 protein [Prevotella melaninogenica]EFC74272.1 glycosyltransferase, group 2 family protein [Prevotella melaninogenica D18]QKH89632.1 glycosyltransferase family 2 protein [Prevotella melaninogenica]
MLSILLPVYNCNCEALVTELHRQCVECGTEFEIIVADDCSSVASYIEHNLRIERLEGVRYITRKQNVGRSAIRNFLISQAQGEWLLFIDGDLTLDNSHFIRRYLQAKSNVVVGGIRIGGDLNRWKNNLRYRYEKAYEQQNTPQDRQCHATKHFRTTNFLAHKDIMMEHSFDENFVQYGYEDVLFGKSLAMDHIAITHIDNPITLDFFESNSEFLDKTEQSLRTLYTFRNQLKGYSQLLETAEKIKKLHLQKLVNAAYFLVGQRIKKHLQGNNPSIFLFNVYKLMYYIHHEKNTL